MLGTVERTAKADAKWIASRVRTGSDGNGRLARSSGRRNLTPCLALLWVSASRSNPEGICRRRSTPATLPSS